jgi:hypothetical protein
MMIETLLVRAVRAVQQRSLNEAITRFSEETLTGGQTV